MATFTMVRRRVKLFALIVAVASLLPACSPSRYTFESNKRLGVYLKMPRTWTRQQYSQDQLLPLYAQGEMEPSPEAYTVVENVMWERAWDSSRTRDVKHFVLGNASAPVARVSVRALSADQRRTISIDTLKNLTLGGYSKDLKDFQELVRNPGTSEVVSSNFVPLVDKELRPGPKSGVRDGFSGVRQLFEARTTSDQSLYVIGFIGVLDDAHTRLYTLTVHCNRACYIRYESDIQKVLDSFTVRKL